jgi:enoyl-CoA hydratase
MVEPKEPMLLEYVSGGRIAIITFNRPQANSSMNTAMSVRFTEILEEIAAPLFSSTAVAPLRGRGYGIRSASVRTDVKDVRSSC